MAKRLETGQYVRNVASCKNLPPCTTIERDERGHNYIVPDMESLQCEIDEGLIPAGTDWPENYRGLFAYISDHGNVTLAMCFKNGNTREIWAVV